MSVVRPRRLSSPAASEIAASRYDVNVSFGARHLVTPDPRYKSPVDAGGRY